MKLAIITGGSRGLGKFLVHTFCNQGYFVISIARGGLNYKHKNLLNHFRQDLTDLNALEKLFVQIDQVVSDHQYQELQLEPH